MKKCLSIIISGLLLGSSLVAGETSKKESLSNKEIDMLFISFEQQARDELKAEQEKAERERLKKQKQQMRSAMSGREVLPHNGDMIVDGSKGGHAGAMPPPPTEIDFSASQNMLTINGILCKRKKCEAVTPNGIIKEGSVLSSGEKIKKITKDKVVTNFRTITF